METTDTKLTATPAKPPAWNWFTQHPIPWQHKEGGDYLIAYSNLGIWIIGGVVLIWLLIRER